MVQSDFRSEATPQRDKAPAPQPPALYSLIIPMIWSSEILRFTVHPLLGRVTETSLACFQQVRLK